MDIRKIADLLRATIDPNQQLQAEEQLTQVLTHVVPLKKKVDDILTYLLSKT